MTVGYFVITDGAGLMVVYRFVARVVVYVVGLLAVFGSCSDAGFVSWLFSFVGLRAVFAACCLLVFVVCWVLGFGVLLAIECLWVCGLLAITRSSGVLWFLVHWYVCLSVGFICGLVVILFACWCVVLFYCWWG